MSIRAISWAFELEIKPASHKLILIALADNASDEGITFPSIAALEVKTSLDRKTIIKGIDELESSGFLQDTGKRTGRTGQVKLYRLVGMDTGLSHYIYRVEDVETGRFYIGSRTCMGSPQNDSAYLGSGSWPLEMTKAKVVLVKSVLACFDSRRDANLAEASAISQHAGDEKCMNKTVPKTERFQKRNSSVSGSKEYRFSHQTVPKTEPVTVPKTEPVTVRGTVMEPEEEEPSLRARDVDPFSKTPIPRSTGSAGSDHDPAVTMALALRPLGVNVASWTPVLVAWVRDGIGVAKAVEAVAVARQAKGPTASIPANYLDRILRDPGRAPSGKPQAGRMVNGQVWLEKSPGAKPFPIAKRREGDAP